jgi:hypothetical protein
MAICRHYPDGSGVYASVHQCFVPIVLAVSGLEAIANAVSKN